MRRFAGQTVFVTGGNKGIGRGIAKRFAEEGAKVAIAAIEKDMSAAAATLTEETGTDVIGLTLDVTDIQAVQEAFTEAEAKLGAISVSVQNAGVITIAKVEDLTEREWDLNLDVNTKGVFLCCQEAVRRFRASGIKGRLINTASGRRAKASSIPRIMPPRSLAWSASPRALPRNSRGKESPPTQFAPVSSTPRCGITMTASGARCSVNTPPAN